MVTMIIIAAIGFFASDIYLPSLPAIANYFQKSNLQVQLTMSVFLFTMAVFQVFMGALSDKFGRKQILILSTGIFIFASLGCFKSASLNELIFFRFLQAIGAASGLSVSQAILADLFGPVKSAKPLSIMIPLVAFSPAIAPILGGLIEEHSNWRNIFLFLAGYGFLIFILLLTPIIPTLSKTTYSKKLSEKSSASVLQILKNTQFIGFAFFMMTSNACYFAFLAASPFLLNKYGYSPAQVGYAFCASSFPYMSASFFGRKLSHKLSFIQIIFVGLLTDCVGVLCMLGFAATNWPHMLSIMIPVFIISIGNGFIMPYSSASAIALYPRNAGLITGSLASLQLCAASIGTLAMGILANGTLYPLAIFNLCIVFCALFYFLRVFRFQLRNAS